MTTSTFDATSPIARPTGSAQPATPRRPARQPRHDVRLLGTDARPLLVAATERDGADEALPTAGRPKFDFSRIPVHSGATPGHPAGGAQRPDAHRELQAAARGVRIHVDASAAARADALDAHAYAQGADVYFRPGAYQPGSRAGRELLLHELAHVVQQQRRAGPSGSTAALEREAERAASDTLAGRRAQIHLSAPASHPQRQKTNWKQSSDVHVNPAARVHVMTQGGLFSGMDQAHVTVSARGRLTYDLDYTTPEDEFRWSRLKDIVDSGHVKIEAVAAGKNFKARPAPGKPPTDLSLTELRLIQRDVSVLGITLKAGGQSPDPTYDLIYYDQAEGVAALSHELFGHTWLALKGAPWEHPRAGTPEEKTLGTLRPGDRITDPFGNVFSGTVRAYINKYIESVGTKAQVANTTAAIPKSPTQGVGTGPLIKAYSALHTQAASGLSAGHYSAPVAQAWRTICSNFDLMPTQAEAIAAGNTNLQFTQEVTVFIVRVLFESWTDDQKKTFRVMLADFTFNRAGLTTNALTEATVKVVGAAPSPFSPGTAVP